MDLGETIAAIATPAGAGGIGVIRISGPSAHGVAGAVFRARSGHKLGELKGYTARLGDVFDQKGGRLDEAVALVYRAPRSYTGEDVAELMCHGGEVVCEAVLREVIAAGAVMASRGEFTRRALVNGRITLTEAEAVCEVINAASMRGGQLAAAMQQGAVLDRILAIKGRALSLQAGITAAIDFPEEDAAELDSGELAAELKGLLADAEKLISGYELGSLLLRGIPAVITGSPNVGKSTLLNLLAGAPRALVTPIAGTTRDVVEQRVRLGGATLLLADTAGIREGAGEIEALGIERAVERAGQASLILAVFDSSRELDADDRRVMELADGKRAVAVINKTDLEQRLDTKEIESRFTDVVYISANDSSALAVMDAAVSRAVGAEGFDPSEPMLANERQRSCAERARDALSAACTAAATSTPDVVYALLDEALETLGELSGENVREEILDEVFSRFCVGK